VLDGVDRRSGWQPDLPAFTQKRQRGLTERHRGYCQ
jgi:hypothetical protein